MLIGKLDRYSGEGLDGLQVPVIMITANEDTKAAAQAISDGVFSYLTKPFDVRHLDLVAALALASTHPADGRFTPTR